MYLTCMDKSRLPSINMPGYLTRCGVSFVGERDYEGIGGVSRDNALSALYNMYTSVDFGLLL